MEQINPQEHQESLRAQLKRRAGAFLGGALKRLRGPKPIMGQHLNDALAQGRHERKHQVVQPRLEGPAVKPDVTDTLQPADVHKGAGSVLSEKPAEGVNIVPAWTPRESERPEWAVDAPAGGVSADAQPMPPGHAVTERPGGVPAGESIPPHAVTRRPGDIPHQ